MNDATRTGTDGASDLPVDTILRLAAQANAHKSWAATPDRLARTAPGRRAADARFLAQADGDPVRAESLRKAFYADLTAKSIRARRAKAGQRAGADA
ncbi:hypothetical protein [Kribbella sp. CA-293567]|uniref:hypothetical protein n=1 Tax=Kribbella sp. CA-293567 TaxID=3002436 RepID=UPI0022DDDD31|nr:hypothetical protein [Kribbella sp. CA-293567]WBQ02952.1 hypothetical protein OX958_23565 [Kribbella sp. CA-293567]